MAEQPKLMSFSRMSDIFESHRPQIDEHVFMNRELAILHGRAAPLFQLLALQQPPFAINDYRMGFIACGEADVHLNMTGKHLSAGMLLFIGPGTIITPVRFSPDLEIYGIGLSADFPMPFPAGQMPPAFNGQARDFQLHAAEDDISTVRSIIETLWHVVRQQDYNRLTVSSLVAALMYHYDGLYRQHADRLSTMRSREQTIFDRFIELVNQHGQQEHQLAFYARRMCLTERYLGTVVRQTSGTTAKEWIDRALVLRIKVELKHTDKSVARIAEELNFPNPSFFSKYFKRLVGQTPMAYREL